MTTIHQRADRPQWAVIEASQFIMGNDHPLHGEDGEQPARSVQLDRYQLSVTTITNRMFAQFVAATGYKTVAEKQGYSHVFKGQLAKPDEHVVAAEIAPWWRLVQGASWQFPNGLMPCVGELPVVHIAYEDALSYCGWAGCRLPTEAEWEYAAGASEETKPHIWRGIFPDQCKGVPSPLAAGDGMANRFGLYHMCGNVWEWTADRFTRLHPPRLTRSPAGPLNGVNVLSKADPFYAVRLIARDINHNQDGQKSQQQQPVI